MEETIIISLGGSLIVPEEVDAEFLKEFRDLILEDSGKGKKFIITVGGGRICRKYQSVAKELSLPSNEDLDWIGIASLKLNAELLRVIFGENAYEKVVSDLREKVDFKEPQRAIAPGQSIVFYNDDIVLGGATII